MEALVPRISVLTIVGEDRSLFQQTTQCLEAQSIQEFELVAVDRAPAGADAPPLWDDPRLRVIAAPGLSEDAAWNYGFERCRYEYVAILAAGHTSRPVRLARQAAWLDRYENVVMVGTASGLRQTHWQAPPEPARTDRDIIHWSLLAGAEMVWSSLMLRRAAAAAAAQGALLREEFGEAARLNLALRLCAVGDVTRIDEVLTLCPADQAKPSEKRLADVRRALVEVYEPILSAGYGPILGDGAARAAELVTRHLVGDEPVPDVLTSAELETVLATLAHSLQVAARAGTVPGAAADIEQCPLILSGDGLSCEAAPAAQAEPGETRPPPRISVLTVAEGDPEWLAASVQSVWAQSLQDFELVVVDRGGRQGRAVLAASQDSRMRLIAAPGLGENAAWNLGFSECRGAYVAMLAAGDISRPARLGHQAAWLDRNQAVVMVGTASAEWQPDRQREPDATRTDRGVILWLLHAGVELAWSSLMVRRETVQALGALRREEYGPAAGFDLCHRLGAVGDVTRLDEVLTLCRARPGRQSDAGVEAARRVLEEAYRPILAEGAAAAASLVARHVVGGAPVPRPALDDIEAVLVQLGGWLKASGRADGVSRAMIAVERSALRDRLARQTARSAQSAAPAAGSAGSSPPKIGSQLGAALSAVWRGTQNRSQTPAAARWAQG
jgi:hypothetical protein